MLCSVVAAEAHNVVTRKSIADPERWINENFVSGKVPPFSFAWEEINTGKLISEWQFSKRKVASGSPDIVNYVVTYVDPSKTVRVTCNIKGYKDCGAVEWFLTFRNISRHNTPKITSIKVADYKMSEDAAKGFTVRYCTGTGTDEEDFTINEFDLRASVVRHFTPQNGLSSKGESLPFYNVISRGADAGLVLAIGWTGSWNARFTGVTSTEYKLFAGLENANFYLRPGEEVRTPLVATVFWKGADAAAGHNAFRRFVLKYHSPKSGGTAWAPVFSGLDSGDPAPCTKYGCLTEDLALGKIIRQKQLGITPQVFRMDAGWYQAVDGPSDAGNFDWKASVGSWIADSGRFPSGMTNISSLIHSYGGQLMLWFEPERVCRNTQIAKEHPEYLLGIPGDKKSAIVDLADDKTVEYLTKYIGDIVEKNGVDHLTLDFNCEGLDKVWAATDAEDRLGITEMRYVTGLYKLWDGLAKRFPSARFSLSATDGSRIDLESVSRGITLFTDGGYEPEAAQSRIYGLNLFLPLSGFSCGTPAAYDARSMYSSSFSADWSVFALGTDSEMMRMRMSEINAVKEYFTKDYYPLSTFNGNLHHNDIWMCSQFNDKKTDSGIVIGFRRSSAKNATFAAELKGIDKDGSYTVYDFNTDKSETVSGSRLASGFEITLSEPGSSFLIKYEKK